MTVSPRDSRESRAQDKGTKPRRGLRRGQKLHRALNGGGCRLARIDARQAAITLMIRTGIVHLGRPRLGCRDVSQRSWQHLPQSFFETLSEGRPRCLKQGLKGCSFSGSIPTSRGSFMHIVILSQLNLQEDRGAATSPKPPKPS